MADTQGLLNVIDIPFFVPTDDEGVPQPELPNPKTISGLFHHMSHGSVTYSTFHPILPSSHKELMPDPSFSSCGEEVTVLVSAHGLVYLRANYIVANPFTFNQVHLPCHTRDHFTNGVLAVVNTFEEAAASCLIPVPKELQQWPH
jgi:hypothetical protein